MKAEMTDIEQQLRFWGGGGETESQACMLQAADEIKRYRAALEYIAGVEPFIGGDAWHMRHRAREALTGRDGDKA
jgi:hypothetical protein